VTTTVRTATTADHDAILAVVRHAFATDGRDGNEEVTIVADTWALGASVRPIELVAVEGDDTAVGHVLAAEADLGGREVLALAPLAVLPGHQGVGVGTALVGALLTRAEAAGWPMVALLGSPAYYGRFGFEPSGPLGVVYPAVGLDDPHFQVRRLSGYGPELRGDLTYCWER
jgi:putative acetyltransferase